MVAGEDPQTTGVYGQALGEAELEREVADQERSACVVEGRAAVAVCVKRIARLGHRALDLIAIRRRFNPIGPEPRQQHHRVVRALFPGHGIEGSERGLDAWLPGPREVERPRAQLVEHSVLERSNTRALTVRRPTRWGYPRPPARQRRASWAASP